MSTTVSVCAPGASRSPTSSWATRTRARTLTGAISGLFQVARVIASRARVAVSRSDSASEEATTTSMDTREGRPKPSPTSTWTTRRGARASPASASCARTGKPESSAAVARSTKRCVRPVPLVEDRARHAMPAPRAPTPSAPIMSGPAICGSRPRRPEEAALLTGVETRIHRRTSRRGALGSVMTCPFSGRRGRKRCAPGGPRGAGLGRRGAGGGP